MRHFTFRFITLFAAAALLVNAATRRDALVVGNDSYPGNALKNARNDAKAVADALGSLGYEVMLQLDTTRKVLNDSIDIFADGLSEGDTAVIYYSGHGVQVNGENYLVPIDFSATSPNDVINQGVSLSSVLEIIARHGATTQVVILDACRDNPFLGMRSMRGGWAGTGTSAGSFLAFGTSPGSTASDNPNEAHGLFTQALLKYLTSSPLNVEQMFEKVRQDVIRESNGLQIPWTASSLIGTLHFNPQLDSATRTRVAAFPSFEGVPLATVGSARSVSNGSAGLAGTIEPPPLPGAPDSILRSGPSPTVDILISEGLQLAQQGDYDDATRSLSAALVADPRSSIALRVLGLIFHILGRSSDAVAELTRAIAINPADHVAYYYRCLALSGNDPASAIGDCEAALGLQQSFAPAHLGLANSLLAVGQAEKAYSEANLAVQLNPDSPLGYVIRGKIETAEGKASAAQQDYQTAIRLTTREP